MLNNNFSSNFFILFNIFAKKGALTNIPIKQHINQK